MAERFERVDRLAVRPARFALDAKTEPRCAPGHRVEVQIDQIAHGAAKIGEEIVAYFSAGEDAAGNDGQIRHWIVSAAA